MNTLFVGQNLISLDIVGSTNNYLANHINMTVLPEGTVVMADIQTGGRGQRDNVWQSGGGDNLTMSVLLRPVFLNVDNYFILNKAVALSVVHTMEAFVDDEVSIKWPNDILVCDKKVAGLLIELSWRSTNCQHAIIGLGVNINQDSFDGLPNATSMSLLGCSVSVIEFMEEFCKNLEYQYLCLKNSKFDSINFSYNNKLWRRGMDVRYNLVRDNELSVGRINRVADDGRLVMGVGDKDVSFANGEIKIMI